jgi:hypothetical protein
MSECYRVRTLKGYQSPLRDRALGGFARLHADLCKGSQAPGSIDISWLKTMQTDLYYTTEYYFRDFGVFVGL